MCKTTTITLEVLLLPTKEQEEELKRMSQRYITIVNELVDRMTVLEAYTEKTSKDINEKLPSVVKNEAIRASNSVFTKVLKSKYTILPVLKKPVCVWNTLGYAINNTSVSLAMNLAGKTKRENIKYIVSKRDSSKLDYKASGGKFGTLRITKKNNKWIAQIAYTVTSKVVSNTTKVLGVDLGIKVPAVAITEDNKVKFFGNGRKNKYERRKYQTIRKNLGKQKKLKKIKQSGSKEKRYMQDQDHKVSRELINFAKTNKIGIIRLEHLSGIRQTTRTSRKNNRSLHNWSFYRLAKYIEYKAKLAGIKVEYVNPTYTSQTCPNCKTKNKCEDRKYSCKCGFEKHRDLVGAMNIRYAPKYVGKRHTA